MTAHNHGYDPTCKETRLPNGKMVGECMTDTTNTPTPRTDAARTECFADRKGFEEAYEFMATLAETLERELAEALESRALGAVAPAPTMKEGE